MRRPINIGGAVSYGQPFGADPAFYRQFNLSGHNGFDYPCPEGTPIFAPESGTITISRNMARDPYTGNRIDGEVVVLKGRHYEHWLLHLSVRHVSEGQVVNEGQHIANSGNTGVSSGPHLHWGTRPHNPDVNNGFRGFIDPTTALAAPPEPVPAPLWTAEAITPKQIKVKGGSRKWNLGHGTFNDVANNPITVAGDNTVFTATAILHHREIPQYNYYLEDANTPHGWNVLDCNDFTPPPPPYVPPAPPIVAPLAERYTVVTRLMRFEKGTDALTHSNVAGDIEQGQYYVISKLHEAYNLSDDNMKDRGWWVNTADNKLPEPVVAAPVVEQPVDVVIPAIEPVDPPAPTARRQYEMISPVQLEAINAVPEVFPDLEGKTTVKAQLNPGSVKEYSMRAFVDGEEYYIPTLSMKRGWRHGIPRDLLDYPQMQGAYNPLDVNEDGKVRWDDFVDFSSKLIDRTRTTVAKVITDPKLVVAKQKLGKSIDGFRRPK